MQRIKNIRGEARPSSSIVKVRGMVEMNSNGAVYIVEKWTSRSRKSYLVTGKLAQNAADLKGKVITVKCCFLERKAWSGVVRVYEIMN